MHRPPPPPTGTTGGTSHRRSLGRRLRRHSRHSPGQALVEFALIAPIFVLVLLTVLDLGRLYYARIAVSNAAREGAMQASKTPTLFVAGAPSPYPTASCDPGTNLVMCRTLLESRDSSSFVSVRPADVRVACNPGDCATGMGNTVTVTVTGHFSFLTPIIAAFFSGNQNLTFSSSSTTQIETLPTPPAGATPVPTPTPTPSPSASPSESESPPPLTCPPSAGFTYTTSPVSDQAPVTLTVADTSTPSVSQPNPCAITSWIWDFGDGSVRSGQTQQPHVYVAPNTYYVTLTVTNGYGSNTSGKVTIKVK